ncbi:uncharacterized protein LOC132604299 isoform X2 [Lycium barbarum]|uniref:uncharacterized protein LOC132604299 isoform X2 n=1 Tax=Lycium barbarum TaxID=112863 RepID=UPI00293E8B47|nr:uncharacterized protein LOC132604299 isoform X2 [Lycium barbarum]
MAASAFGQCNLAPRTTTIINPTQRQLLSLSFNRQTVNSSSPALSFTQSLGFGSAIERHCEDLNRFTTCAVRELTGSVISAKGHRFAVMTCHSSGWLLLQRVPSILASADTAFCHCSCSFLVLYLHFAPPFGVPILPSAVYIQIFVENSYKMEQRLNIAAITPATKDWTCKVQVVDKFRPRESKDQKTHFQIVIVQDEHEKQICIIL